jgi:hypothetical protein
MTAVTANMATAVVTTFRTWNLISFISALLRVSVYAYSIAGQG